MISDVKSDDCLWILQHPFHSANFQLFVLVSEVFMFGMLVGLML